MAAASGRLLANKLSRVGRQAFRSEVLGSSSSKMATGSQVLWYSSSTKVVTGSVTGSQFLWSSSSSKVATGSKVSGPYPFRKMSTESTGSQASKLAEDLVKALKEAPSDGSTEKLINMAQDLLKAIKAPPMVAEANEFAMLGIKVMHMEGGLSELKANSRLTASVTFTIFGVIACILFALPKDVHEMKVEVKTNQKACEAREKNNEIKYKKLKSRIQVLEAKATEEIGGAAVGGAAGGGSCWGSCCWSCWRRSCF